MSNVDKERIMQMNQISGCKIIVLLYYTAQTKPAITEVQGYVDAMQTELIDISDKLWGKAALSLQEKDSSQLIMDSLTAHDFKMFLGSVAFHKSSPKYDPLGRRTRSTLKPPTPGVSSDQEEKSNYMSPWYWILFCKERSEHD
jgi:hypothetical protein